MSGFDGELTYYIDPEPDRPLLKEGVTTAWVVIWDGTPGPARTMQVAALADEDGNGVIVPTGEWHDTEVVDDRQKP